MIAGLRRLSAGFDHWLFERPDPKVCSLLRIAFGTVLLVYWSMWWRESTRWFSDAGVLQAETMQRITDGGYPSLLFWLPGDPATIKICLAIAILQTVLLWVGIWSRLQAACIFVWLVSFQHRNMVICDGQDVLIRLLAFYLVFMPLDYAWSLRNWWRDKGWRRWRESTGAMSQAVRSHAAASHAAASRPAAWGLRLVQLQITAVYLSTAWEKYQGLTWRDGTALFYVSRMDDLYGRFALPDMLFENPAILTTMTWSVLLVEGSLPLLLWLRATRFWAVLLAVGLHLSIEASMHVYLFQWLMLVSLLAFVDPKWFRKAN